MGSSGQDGTVTFFAMPLRQLLAAALAGSDAAGAAQAPFDLRTEML